MEVGISLPLAHSIPANTILHDGLYLPAFNRFPSAGDGDSFKPLADYVQSPGLKFGIHIVRTIPREGHMADKRHVDRGCASEGAAVSGR